MVEELPKPLEVEVADAKSFLVFNVYRNCKLRINGEDYNVDLIPMVLGEFDVVIGMDWLSNYGANIVCNRKIIQLVSPSGRDTVIQGERKGGVALCSLIKAMKHIARGGQSFLAYVVDTDKKVK